MWVCILNDQCSRHSAVEIMFSKAILPNKHRLLFAEQPLNLIQLLIGLHNILKILYT